MRRILPALLLWPAMALADEPPAQFKLQLGKSKPFSVGGPVAVGTCDDTTIVKVEDGGDALKLTGLKVGKTLCGFWKSGEGNGRHTVIEVVVTKEDPDALPAKVN